MKVIVALKDVVVSVTSPDTVPETAQSSLNATPVAKEDEPRLSLRTLSIAIFKISFPVRGVDVSTPNAEIMVSPVDIASAVVDSAVSELSIRIALAGTLEVVVVPPSSLLLQLVIKNKPEISAAAAESVNVLYM